MHLLSQTTRQCDNASFPYINCHKRRDSAITRLFHTSIVIKRRVSAITRLFHTSIVTKRRALYTYTARNAAFAYSSCHKKTRLLVLVYSAQRGFCIHQLSQKDAPCTRTQHATRLLHTSVVTKKTCQPCTRTQHATRLLHTSAVTKRRALHTYTAHNAAFAYISCHKYTPCTCTQRATRLLQTPIVTKRHTLNTYTARNAAFAYISCHKKMCLVHVHSTQRGFYIHQLSQKDAPCTLTQHAMRFLHTPVVTKRLTKYMYIAHIAQRGRIYNKTTPMIWIHFKRWMYHHNDLSIACAAGKAKGMACSIQKDWNKWKRKISYFVWPTRVRASPRDTTRRIAVAMSSAWQKKLHSNRICTSTDLSFLYE